MFINALQNLLFCIPKAAVLHGKSVGFASQKSRFRNAKAQLSLFKRIIFTKPRLFFSNCYRQEKDIVSLQKHCLSLYFREREHCADF
ncbi:hypothetical protein CTM62_06950 [Prevotella intermedia]|uniref:Uncharacterized protein n=1 Tax=Prevotella intermedia TaxID=28131 RepID=A0A2D3L7B5_PREIN|nr:hypothetical protein CTM62_06950 [Prevotella intermedia]